MNVELADGRKLEFPEGTDPAVIQRTVKNLIASKSNTDQQAPIAPQNQEKNSTFGGDIARQIGLTARHGIEGVGDTLDFMASPIRAGINTILPQRAQISGRTGEAISNAIGLPQPGTDTERIAGDVARTMAGAGGMGGIASKAVPFLKGVPQKLAELLASKQGAQQLSAAGAGAAGGIARESDIGPIGQTAAALAGGVAAPSAVMAGNLAGKQIANTGATVGASFGNKRGIERIAKDAAVRVAGDSREKQLAALLKSTEYAPGVKPTAAEAIAEAQMGRPEQFGGATIKLQKDLSGAQGIEDVIPSAVRQQNQAMAAHLKSVKTDAKPMRDTAIDLANQRGGVDPKTVISKIDQSLSTVGKKSDDLFQKTLGDVKNKIADATDPQTGLVDAKELYTIRKKIGNTLKMFSKETANWDKKDAARIEREVQLYIDDAIESAGGQGWRDYLKFYSSGMKSSENQAARLKEAKTIASGVKGSNAATLAAGELPKPPTLLSRPMMALNFGLRMISRDANTPVAKRMAEAMTDPKEYARLLRLPATDPVGKQARDIAQRASLAALLYQQGQQ